MPCRGQAPVGRAPERLGPREGPLHAVVLGGDVEKVVALVFRDQAEVAVGEVPVHHRAEVGGCEQRLLAPEPGSGTVRPAHLVAVEPGGAPDKNRRTSRGRSSRSSISSRSCIRCIRCTTTTAPLWSVLSVPLLLLPPAALLVEVRVVVARRKPAVDRPERGGRAPPSCKVTGAAAVDVVLRPRRNEARVIRHEFVEASRHAVRQRARWVARWRDLLQLLLLLEKQVVPVRVENSPPLASTGPGGDAKRWQQLTCVAFFVFVAQRGGQIFRRRIRHLLYVLSSSLDK